MERGVEREARVNDQKLRFSLHDDISESKSRIDMNEKAN